MVAAGYHHGPNRLTNFTLGLWEAKIFGQLHLLGLKGERAGRAPCGEAERAA